VSTIRFFGIVCFSASTMLAQLSPVPGFGLNHQIRQFEANRVADTPYSVPLVTASGETRIMEEVPGRSANKPISGVVSLRELQHPVSKKALREAYDAQRYSRANDGPKAIAKLEKAIRIDPAYRDAHLNLGVQYSRAGRIADARAEFQKALDIGPPAAPIYIDLALTSLALRQYHEAETFARKALELDPANSEAQQALGYASNLGF
jgi:tetratricopeptide (TPR) repeat protein